MKFDFIRDFVCVRRDVVYIKKKIAAGKVGTGEGYVEISITREWKALVLRFEERVNEENRSLPIMRYTHVYKGTTTICRGGNDKWRIRIETGQILNEIH